MKYIYGISVDGKIMESRLFLVTSPVVSQSWLGNRCRAGPVVLGMIGLPTVVSYVSIYAQYSS